jgi:hypothetical protein
VADGFNAPVSCARAKNFGLLEFSSNHIFIYFHNGDIKQDIDNAIRPGCTSSVISTNLAVSQFHGILTFPPHPFFG